MAQSPRNGTIRDLGFRQPSIWKTLNPVLEAPTQYNPVFGKPSTQYWRPQPSTTQYLENPQPSIGGPNPVQPSIWKTRNPVLEAPTQYNPVFGKPSTQYWRPQPSTTQYLENPQPSIGGPNPVQTSIRKTLNPVLEAPTQYKPVFGKPSTQYWRPQPSTTQYLENPQPSIGGPNPVQPSIWKTLNPVLEALTQYNPVFGKPSTQYWRPQPSTTQYLENPQPSIGGPNPVQPSMGGSTQYSENR